MYSRLLLVLAATALLHYSYADGDAEVPDKEPAAEAPVPAPPAPATATEEDPAEGASGSGSAKEAPGGACKVADFAIGAGYSTEGLLGAWHVVDDTGLVPLQRTFDALFHAVQDLKHHFVRQEDGSIKDITSLRTPFGCYTQVGVLVESGEAGQLTSSYPTSWFAAQKNASPFWVVAMDSTSWALVYSCRKVAPDGSCEPKHTTAWTMSRSPEGFSDEVAQTVHAAVDVLCVEYDDFRAMPKSKTCPDINPDDFPNVVKPKSEL